MRVTSWLLSSILYIFCMCVLLDPGKDSGCECVKSCQEVQSDMSEPEFNQVGIKNKMFSPSQ